MGRKPQPKPRYLASKLRSIRLSLRFSQQAMTDRLKALTPKACIQAGHVSQFESGKRLPSFLVLLAYARIAKVSTDALIDDQISILDDLD